MSFIDGQQERILCECKTCEHKFETKCLEIVCRCCIELKHTGKNIFFGVKIWI